MSTQRTRWGWRTRFEVLGRPYSKRWKPNTRAETMEAWERHTRADAERARVPVHPPGSFAADAETYLAAVKAMPTYTERKRDIGLWVEVFGKRRRDSIQPYEIRAVRDRWLTEGPKMVQQWERNPLTGHRDRVWVPVKKPLSASTVCHRMRALENLWTVLDGRQAPNPVRQVPEPEEPDAPPRALPVALVRAILDAMPTSKAKARLEVLAWTGIPYATLARMNATMVDAEGLSVWVPGRKKGKGTAGRQVPLTPDGLAALQAVEREDAWTRASEDRGTSRRAFRLACRKVEQASAAAGVTIDLSRTRPYDLRHSIATLVALAGDFRDTESLLGVSHATAARYAKGAINPRLVAAVAALGRAQQGEGSATQPSTPQNP